MKKIPKRSAGIAWAFMLIATSAYSQPPASIIDHDIAFGPQQHMSGVYSSNFENSKFTACDRRKGECDGNGWLQREQEWVYCSPAACDDLENRIKRLVGSHDKWGLYRLDFMGRRSANRTQKKFINDEESKVYLEKIELFELIRTE